MPRASRGRQDTERQHAEGDDLVAHSAHAELRRDDDDRLPAAQRRARGGRDISRPTGRRCAAGGSGVLPRSIRHAGCRERAGLERLESVARQRSLCSSRARRPDRGAGAAIEIEMGVWLRRRYLRLLAANGDRQPGVHRQRWRCGACLARRQWLPAMDVSGQRSDPIGDRRGPERWQAGAPVRRPHRMVLRARCIEWPTGMEEAPGRPRGRARERAASCARRHRVCGRRLVGRITIAQS